MGIQDYSIKWAGLDPVVIIQFLNARLNIVKREMEQLSPTNPDSIATLEKLAGKVEAYGEVMDFVKGATDK